MTHGDDSGRSSRRAWRRAPGRHRANSAGNWQETVLPRAQSIRDELVKSGVRVFLDDRDAYNARLEVCRGEMRGAASTRDWPGRISRKARSCSCAVTRAKKPLLRWPALPRTSEYSSRPSSERSRSRAEVPQEHSRFASRRTRDSTAWTDGRGSSCRPGVAIPRAGADQGRDTGDPAEHPARRRSLVRRRGSRHRAPCLKCGRPAVAEAWFAKAC